VKRNNGPMRLVVVTWDGGSNRQPFELMCGALAGRGDTVDVLSHRTHRGLYEALGVAFHALGVGEGPPGLRRSLSEEFARVMEIWRSPEVADETAAVLASVSPDVAVVDGLMLTAAAACEAAGVPVVAMEHTLPGATWLGPRRDLFEGRVAPVNDVRRRLGLDPVGSFGELMATARVHIVASVAELDAPVPWDVPLRYVGPMQQVGDQSPVTELPDRFILVSFSTTWQRQVVALQHVVDALSGLDRPVVVTTGRSVDPSEITAAANTFVFGELPHQQILDRADVVVTHAGHGTVLSALTAGVPLVCLPLGRDQHDVARRVVAVGAGVTVDSVQDEAAIRDGVLAVIRNASYADQAATLAQAIAHYRGIQEVLEILDSTAT
jgi:UDP:flavonoid glycosyltransferase YjiC (YdhE family)